MSFRHTLKSALKRGALVAAANWPVALVQSIADGLFKLVITVPLVGGAVLVTLVIGADTDALLTVDWRVLVTSVVSSLLAHRFVLAAFLLSLSVVVIGGSLLVYLVKAGTIGVLVQGDRQAGAVEAPPLQLEVVATAAAFSMELFIQSARTLFPRFARLGFSLMAVYVISGAAYVVVVLASRDGGGLWVTTLATVAFVAWTTIVNLLYLLVQIVIAADDCRVMTAARRVGMFLRHEPRLIMGVFAVVLAMVVLATGASLLAFAALGLIFLIPFVWLAAVPLQLIAFVLRAVVFQYIGVSSVGAYLKLYREFRGLESPAGNVTQLGAVGAAALEK